MALERIDRRACDNEYLHKDFHLALSVGIQYLDDHYGADAVRRYLREFTLAYYGPLIAKVHSHGLSALREHFETIYAGEHWDAEISGDEDELIVQVNACPAVTHIRQSQQVPARLFHETTRVVNETLCQGTPFAAELLDYDSETGAAKQRFWRRTTEARTHDHL